MNRIRQFRQTQGWSQLVLAQKVGVTRQTVNMIENNNYNPSLDLCIRLARALDTDLNTLFWFPEETEGDH
ncbi:helix-turn-helix transcriptional regulator [Schleiferilactobacillus perolens]|jgi:putative transcriptional regulator|uniref:helix-turn-helix transcriptional regulator n=1 Tax=Schleiferilactobacillus perolens TaxID=100468 RepID=UPI002355D3A4|nr:helix-turn-helix transcriptional regulator [Schleiferilactobacillus perolens]MCI2170847.1 helix-turn-helix transcriptional regulator [Schleiferilactobacillus perolens]